MHHLPIVSFQNTSGAHMLPSTSGFVDCLDHSSQMSPRIVS